MPILRAAHICKSFGDTVALHDVSLGVLRGEVVAILGRSGSGKTTLLRCLNMLERIDTGFIEFAGHRVIEGAPATPASANHGGGEAKPESTGEAGGDAAAAPSDGSARNGTSGPAPASPPAAATGPPRTAGHARVHVNENHFRRKFGVVLETNSLFPHRTVLQNVVEGPLFVLRQRRKHVLPAAYELLRTIGVGERANAYPDELDRSEQRRVELVRAVMMKPEVMLLDEITGGLYPPDVAALLDVVAALRAYHNAAIILVTHHIEFARNVADKLCFLDRGHLVETGPPDKLLDTPQSPALRGFLAAVRAAL